MKYLLLLGFVAFTCILLPAAAWAHPITVDGNDDDWIGVSGAEDSWVYSAGEGIWDDARNDDLGDGGDAPLADDNPGAYTYPTDVQFLGTEADIREWRVTADPAVNKLYFLIKVDYALTWMPLIGICVDVDHIPGSGQSDCGAYGEVNVSPQNEWEYSIVARNTEVVVMDSVWTTVTGSHESFFQADTTRGLIELGIDVSSWSPSPWGKTVYFTVYGALNDFNNCRNVDSLASQWKGGGGYNDAVSTSDPKIYDLCFVANSDQANDLNQYTNASRTTIRSTTVRAVNLDLVPVERNTWGRLKIKFR